MTGGGGGDSAVDVAGIGKRDFGQLLAGSGIFDLQPSAATVNPVTIHIALPIILPIILPVCRPVCLHDPPPNVSVIRQI